MSKRVERVVIVGRDAALWLSVLALIRALGRTGIHVEAVELPSSLRPVDAYTAVPSIRTFHRLLGIDEAEVMVAAKAVPSLGQRFSNWSKALPPFIHGYDPKRAAIDNVDFLQFWVKARGEGMNVAFEDFSPAAAAAKQGRVPAGEGGEDQLGASVGLHLDAQGYVALARAHALHAGARHRRTRGLSVESEGDRILAVTLEDGERVEGDLFVDASGGEAILIGRMPGDSFETWKPWLPCDRLIAASLPAMKPLPGFAEIGAFPAGWMGLFPLQDRTAFIAAFDSGLVGEDEVLQGAARLTGVPLAPGAVAAPFEAGCRAAPWIGNCVAIGDGAISLEPLDAVQLHPIHIGISHLAALFPVEAGRMPEASVYNKAIAAHARNIRDFQIAHYRLNQRIGESIWDRARESKGPESLETKMRLFAARGEGLLYDDETFEEQNWASIFVGHGLIPRSYTARVDAVPDEEQMARFQSFLGRIAGEVRAMPTVEAYIGERLQPSAPGGF